MSNRKPEPELPYLTSDLPGTGGHIRERLEDFVVEEIPLYQPSGAGEHLYLTIQKVGISTHEAVRKVAKALGISANSVGYAGMKDSRALARQTISLSGVPEARALALEVPGVQVLQARRHGNKLRMGHLKGNRFVLRIRGTGEGAAAAAGLILDRLEEAGVPNMFGPQRFGSRGDAHTVGRAIVRRDEETAVSLLLGGPSELEKNPKLGEARRRYEAGDLAGALECFPGPYQAERRVLEALNSGRSPQQALKRIPKKLLRIIVCSYQSFLFNRLLANRISDLGKLEEGDLAYLHDRGAVFLVSDLAEEQPRADRFEISPSAPLFGKKVIFAEGDPGARERALLEEESVDAKEFSVPGARLNGERRALRVPMGSPRAREDGEDAIVISFSLPRGSYATTVLREVIKTRDPGLDAPC